MEEEMKKDVLDSPLVVHKKDDASFQETANEVTMSATHTDEESADTPTLERHRFKKKKKKSKAPYVILVLVAIAAAVICVLVYNDVIPIGKPETTTTTKKSYTTQQVNEFEGIITVKGTYIFFEGTELDGLRGLEKEIKYLEKGTKFVVQDEDADSNFLNFDVLSLLSQYSIDYEIKHIVSSGLIAEYEKMSTTTSAAKKTENQSDNKSTSSATTEKQTGNQ